MKCRCGHGRSTHYPTAKNRKGYADRVKFRLANRLPYEADHIKQPCHHMERSTAPEFPPCTCRDWHPKEEKTDVPTR